MIHAFLLMAYLGTGDSRALISNDMYFYSIDKCNYFASQLAKRYGNYVSSQFTDPKDRVTVYCIPKRVDPRSVEVY